MLVILKSSPGSSEARRGLKIAQDLSSDLVLIQNSTCLAAGTALEDFTGKVYAIDEDLKLRGAKSSEGVELIGYGMLIDMMSDADKVIGMF
jgi:sulfur relay protein TusB/DsrH